MDTKGKPNAPFYFLFHFYYDRFQRGTIVVNAQTDCCVCLPGETTDDRVAVIVDDGFDVDVAEELEETGTLLLIGRACDTVEPALLVA